MPTNLELEKQISELTERLARSEAKASAPPKLLRSRPTRPSPVAESVVTIWDMPIPTGATVRINDTSELYQRIMFGKGLICVVQPRKDEPRCGGEVEWVENEPRYRCTVCSKVERLKLPADIWHKIRAEGMLGTVERFKGNTHRGGELKFSVYLPGITQFSGEGVRYSDLSLV